MISGGKRKLVRQREWSPASSLKIIMMWSPSLELSIKKPAFGIRGENDETNIIHPVKYE